MQLTNLHGLAAVLLTFLSHLSPVAVILSAKLSVIMPLVVAFVNQPKFSDKARPYIAIATCIVASGIVCLAAGALNGLNWATCVVLMTVSTWNLYHYFYKPSGIAPWFEAVTNLLPYAFKIAGGAVAIAYQKAASGTNAVIEQAKAEGANDDNDQSV